MSTYTEFFFKAELDPDTPSAVIQVLRHMVGDYSDYDRMPHLVPPKHALFDTDDSWRSMLRAGPLHIFKANEIDRTYKLTVLTNFKCYQDEIKKFVNWIYPWLDKGSRSFLGHYCSEWDGMPVLIERSRTGISYGWEEGYEVDDSPFRPEVTSGEEESGGGDAPWRGILEEHARDFEALSGINCVARGTTGPAKSPSDSSTHK